MVGDDLLPADPAGDADDIRADTVGFLAVAKMGRGLGQMDDKVLNGTFLWGDVVLRGLLLHNILLIIRAINFIKLFT